MIIQSAHVFIQNQIAYQSFLYIGPGMDGGMVSLVVAFLISFFTYLIAIIWYPVKKMIHFFKKLTDKVRPQNVENDHAPDNNSTTDGKG